MGRKAWSVGVLALGVVALASPGCDDDEGDDESTASMTSSNEDGSGSEGIPTGCEDGTAMGEMVEIGETRVCACDDGEASTQLCLATGMFTECECAGGGW